MSDTCPNCGHCDKCGRSNFKPWNPYPGTGTWVQPYWSVIPPNYSPPWGQTYTISGTNQISGGSTSGGGIYS